jgi:hypothetical protein
MGKVGAKIVEGKRNDNLFRLACALRNKGLSTEAIQAALLVENRTKCHPPLNDVEINEIVGSSSRYQPSSHHGASDDYAVIGGALSRRRKTTLLSGERFRGGASLARETKVGTNCVTLMHG